VFMSTIRGILGDYHTTAPMDTFVMSHQSGHPTDLAGLIAARLVTAAEIDEGKTWAEAKIKSITGGDEISARFMRQDFFTFVPVFKLMIAGNHKPRLRTIDEAIRRRMRLIPFNVTIPRDERDKHLAEKLKAEWPAILRWMIDGCLRWQAEGLNPPPAVADATDEYLSAEDSLNTWIEEKCACKPRFEDEAGNLFTSWKGWAERNGEYVGSAKAFGAKLQAKGYVRRRANGKTTYAGIQVVESWPAQY
jgi:putative DNA primase/helicase